MPTTIINIRSGDKYNVYIGRGNKRRGTVASKWACPFVVGKDGTREEVVKKYEVYLIGNSKLMNSLPELKDKILGCWCKPLLCHGDVLVKYANKENN